MEALNTSKNEVLNVFKNKFQLETSKISLRSALAEPPVPSHLQNLAFLQLAHMTMDGY